MKFNILLPSSSGSSLLNHILMNFVLPLFLGYIIVEHFYVETFSNVVLSLFIAVIIWNITRVIMYNYVHINI
jgi:hypothetical protein